MKSLAYRTLGPVIAMLVLTSVTVQPVQAQVGISLGVGRGGISSSFGQLQYGGLRYGSGYGGLQYGVGYYSPYRYGYSPYRTNYYGYPAYRRAGYPVYGVPSYGGAVYRRSSYYVSPRASYNGTSRFGTSRVTPPRFGTRRRF